MPTQTFLTVDQAAAALNLSPSGVRGLLRQGRLAAVKVGRVWRIPQLALDELARRAAAEAQQRQQPPVVLTRRNGWTKEQLDAISPRARGRRRTSTP